MYATHTHALKKLIIFRLLNNGRYKISLIHLQCLLPSQYHDSIDQVGWHNLQHENNEIVYKFVGPYRSIGVPQTGVEWILICVSFSFGQHLAPSQTNDVSFGYIVTRNHVFNCITITIQSLNNYS